jgi:SAM-dependent methyltransferase
MSQQIPSDLSSDYYDNQPELKGLVSALAWHVRKKMFYDLMQISQPSSSTKILDVGVTCNRRKESNFFEKLYPYPQNITAVGVEDASFLEKDFPGLTFVQTNGGRLPFSDKSFDLVVAFAVIEHVGSRKQQELFIQELCRVGRQVCVTTPNRWFPVEFHTVLPFLHWLPPKIFRRILFWLGHDFYAQESNLNLLDKKTLQTLFPSQMNLRFKRYRLLGLTSNLMIYTCKQGF